MARDAVNPGKKDSFGFEARPYVGLNLPMDQTSLGFSYFNSSSWYEARSRTQADAWDFTHEATLKFDHAFSPRYRIGVHEDVLYGQEPDTTTTGITVTPQRINSSYLRNVAAFTFFGQLTQQLGLSVNYNNTYWDYFQTGPGSYAALLDRMEHLIPVSVSWQVKPDLSLLAGYNFGLENYTGNNLLYPIGTIPNFRSSDRDSISHSIYLGGDYDITGQLKVSLRGGAQYTTYEHFSGNDQWTPYVDCSVGYTYLPGSHADLGFKHSMSATDMAASDGTRPTLDQEISAIYLNVNHQITAKLSANVLAQYQLADFHGGSANAQSEQFFLLGTYLNYRVNPFLAFEAGYNFDYLDSDIAMRGYTRNRVFLGVRATY